MTVNVARVQDKVALVSGAARGQGEAEARLFVQEGAMVRTEANSGPKGAPPKP